MVVPCQRCGALRDDDLDRPGVEQGMPLGWVRNEGEKRWVCSFKKLGGVAYIGFSLFCGDMPLKLGGVGPKNQS